MPVRRLIRHLTKKDWRYHRRNMVINHELNRFTRASKENLATLIMSAFGFVAALSWNELIKEAINTLIPSQRTLVAKAYSAAIVTLISVIVVYFLSRLKEEK